MKKVLIGILVVALVLLVGYFLQDSELHVEISEEEAVEIAEDWIADNAGTYVYRGGDELVLESSSMIEDNVYELFFYFESAEAGYGEKADDEFAAQVITPHTIRVVVENGEVVEAITDETFDEIEGTHLDDENDEDLEETAAVELYYVQVIDGVEGVAAIDKEIDLVNGVEESAILALLEEVEDEDYSSAIPDGVELLSFDLTEGVATVDFSSEIDPGGGSAWIINIQDQITKTLLQFDSVEEVVILVEGEEDALQP